MSDETKVQITAEDIAEGEPGNCYRCAIARALHRATGDDEANVYDSGDGYYLQVHGRHLRLPWEAREFVLAYDRMSRTGDGKRIEVTARTRPAIHPIAFEIPPIDDPEWEERCYRCEKLFDPADLDDEGVCEDCRAEHEPEQPR